MYLVLDTCAFPTYTKILNFKKILDIFFTKKIFKNQTT